MSTSVKEVEGEPKFLELIDNQRKRVDDVIEFIKLSITD